MDESLVILEAKNMYHIYESLSLESVVFTLVTDSGGSAVCVYESIYETS